MEADIVRFIVGRNRTSANNVKCFRKVVPLPRLKIIPDVHSRHFGPVKLLVIFFIFGVIVIAAIYDWNFDPPVEKDVTSVVTYETMSNNVGSLCSSSNSKE